jgi:hypothetical protein
MTFLILIQCYRKFRWHRPLASGRCRSCCHPRWWWTLSWVGKPLQRCTQKKLALPAWPLHWRLPTTSCRQFLLSLRHLHQPVQPSFCRHQLHSLRPLQQLIQKSCSKTSLGGYLRRPLSRSCGHQQRRSMRLRKRRRRLSGGAAGSCRKP